MNKLALIIVMLTFLVSGCGSPAPKNIALNNLILSETKDVSGNIQNVFKDLATIYLSFEVTDFTRKKDGIVWIQEDVQLTGPDGKVLEWSSSLGEVKKFAIQNYLDINKKLTKKIKVIPLSNTLTLPSGLASGEYKLLVTIRDKIGQSQVAKEIIFKLNFSEKKKDGKK